MVILGGYPVVVGETRHSMKRRWNEILSVGKNLIPVIVKSNRPSLSFNDSDLLNGKANKWLPLIVSAVVAGTEVERILIDQGSSADLLFRELLPKLKIVESDLSAFDGSDLTGFNGSCTTPQGYIELQVMYEDDKLSKIVKTRFLVLPCPCPYQCIVGRPNLGKLGAATSIIHLKMKFFSQNDQVVTIPADLDTTRRFQYLCLKVVRRAKKEAASKSGSNEKK